MQLPDDLAAKITIHYYLDARDALLKGLALLFATPGRIASTYKSVGFERYFAVWMGVVLVFGLWMAITAFAA